MTINGIFILSLHDALPIFGARMRLTHVAVAVDDQHRAPNLPAHPLHFIFGSEERSLRGQKQRLGVRLEGPLDKVVVGRSEEHTSELQSLTNLVFRLLLEKK